MKKRYPLTGDELRLRDRARREVKLMVKDCGGWKPDKCEKCGRKCVPEAHHSDYTFPLWIRYLCKKCHAKADVKVKRERIRQIKEREKRKKMLEDREKNCFLYMDLWVRKDSKWGQKILARQAAENHVPLPVPTT